MKPLRLGKMQRMVLSALRRNGYWRRGCFWYWGTWKQTERFMSRFLELGLVYQDDYGAYRLTEKGEEVEKL